MRRTLVSVAMGMLTAASAAPAYADVVIGPRASYYFDNSNLRTSGVDAGLDEDFTLDPADAQVLRDRFGAEPELQTYNDGAGILADQLAFAMFGGMVNFGDDRDRFTLTAMYGQAEGNVAQSAALVTNLFVGGQEAADLTSISGRSINDASRTDVELTWQRRTSERFAFLAGARYERLDTAFDGMLTITQSSDIPNLIIRSRAELNGDPLPPVIRQPAIVLDYRQSGVIQTFSARAGATAFVPFSDNAVAFFNGMLQASYQPDYDVTTTIEDPGDVFSGTETESETGEFSIGPDFAVGAQFILSSNLALDLRYRAVLFFPLSGQQTFSDARVNHGVNIGLSLRL